VRPTTDLPAREFTPAGSSRLVGPRFPGFRRGIRPIRPACPGVPSRPPGGC